MTPKLPYIAFFCLLAALLPLTADEKTDKQEQPANAESKTQDKQNKFEAVEPQNERQARELFDKAFGFAREEEWDKAILCYKKLLAFYEKNTEQSYLIVRVLDNLAMLHSGKGEYQEAGRLFARALEYSTKLDMHDEVSDFHYKLGILHRHLADVKTKKEREKNTIYPTDDRQPRPKQLYQKGVYTRVLRQGNHFTGHDIHITGPQNPYQKVLELFSKYLNIKLKDDVNPDVLIEPDSLRVTIQASKAGYHDVVMKEELLPDTDYSELIDTMLAIPRKVEPKIFEDFYLNGPVIADEITLARMFKGQSVSKPVSVNAEESFKPGQYQLFIKKAGYEDLRGEVYIPPANGPFALKRDLQSKLRNLAVDIRSNYNAEGDTAIPYEVSLNGQEVSENSKAKPGHYKLVVRAEGHEPVMRDLTIEPSGRPMPIQEYLRCLPREVIFQLTGDYRPEDPLIPDEISLNGDFVRPGGESVLPNAYQMFIRKKGYEPITQRIIIRPQNDPYVIKHMMKALPRRVKLKTIATFPKHQLIAFPDFATLNSRDINTVESFSPGSYTFFIKHAGYRPVTRNIEISPSDEPYLLEQTLDPKEVNLNLNITYDVDPLEPELTHDVSLESQDGSIIRIDNGDNVTPNNYLLKIQRSGYEVDVQQQLVMPSDDALVIERRLVAKPRRIITRITAEFPAGKIDPDEITINGQPLTSELRIKPGMHDILILKEGYLPIRKTVKILASDKDFTLSETLITKRRLVEVEILDSYNRRRLSPDELYMGTVQVSTREAVPMKPGNYSLRAHLKGYRAIDEQITIPVGSATHQITRFMEAIIRLVKTRITSDYTDDVIEPDIFTLNGQKIAVQGNVKPGKFNLVIQEKGYFPILEVIEIEPDPEPYLIERRLASKPRKLDISVISSFSGEEIAPQQLVIGAEDVKDGQEIKPGKYQLTIKERGYRTLSEQIDIAPAEEPYTLERHLEALERVVQYHLTNDFDGQETAPDVITLNDEMVDQKKAFLPGKYTLQVKKSGFHPKYQEILITPSDEPYVIEAEFESMERRVEAVVYGDFPKDQAIDPEILALGTRDIREHVFKPGKYELTIEQPGFFTQKKDVVVPPGEDPHFIEETLITKPRKVKQNFSFDVAPSPEDNSPLEVTAALLSDPKEVKELKDGDLLKPNSYIITIRRKAYETVELRRHVWPDEAPLLISEELQAKMVTVNLNVSHNIPAPADLPGYQASIIDQRNFVYIDDGKKVKPGEYELSVHRPGYHFGLPKPISIVPSEEVFAIHVSLRAKKRKISFDMVHESKLVPAHEIINAENGKKVSYEDEFEPGTALDLIVKFKKYATIRKKVHVVPGEGPLIVNVPLQELKRYDFSIRKNEMKLDGISYPYRFKADNQFIEDHHISIEKGTTRYYYTIRALSQAKELKAVAGYLFAQKPFARVPTGIGTLNSIDIEAFIEHLDKVKDLQRGRRASLVVLQDMLRTYSGKRRLSQCHPNELDQLISTVEGWSKELDGTQDRIALQVVKEALDAIRNK